MSVQPSKPNARRLSAGLFLGMALAIAGGLVISAQISPAIAASSAPRAGVEQDRQLLRDFGIARHALTAEEAAELPDLYSSSLTGGSNYSWNSEDYAFRLSPDRILPLSQIVKLGGKHWSLEKKRAFGSDTDNFSPTSHAANSWKGMKTPADIAEDQKAGSFSWTDPCADVYKDTIVFTPTGGCEGAPEDFDRCGYAERYLEIAARYELKIPREDRDALKELTSGCS